MTQRADLELAGLTQPAASIGVTRATIYARESSDKEPGKVNLSGLARVDQATNEVRVSLAITRGYGFEPSTPAAAS